MKKINVLIACEISQIEMQAFRDRGCNAFSCDTQLLQGKGDIRYHIPYDVTPLLEGYRYFYTQDARLHHVPYWDLIIAHPPCTYLCKVGSVHLRKEAYLMVQYDGHCTLVNEDRFNRMIEARKFFFKCLNAKAKHVCVENPLPMAIAQLPKPDAYICPSWFGAKYSKKTLYWLKNLPPLMATIESSEIKSYVRSSRGKYRSRSFKEVAEAMAEQWIPLLL